MQARRRDGLNSFQMQLPSESTYPMSDQKPQDADAWSLNGHLWSSVFLNRESDHFKGGGSG
jgi:hypothetical protein